MIFVCGNVSSSSLIDAARPTVRGRTVQGKITKLRRGRIERTLGIDCPARSEIPVIAAASSGADFASAPRFKAISGSSFIPLMEVKSRKAHCAVRHAPSQYLLTPRSEERRVGKECKSERE